MIRRPSRVRAVLVALFVLSGLAFAGNRTVSATEPSPYPGGQQPPAAQYGVGADRAVMVPMDDGVNIRLQVFYPTNLQTGAREPGPFPVLLTQSPYSLSLMTNSNVQNVGEYFVQRGYIVVQSDQRGTGLSGGNEWGVFGPRDAKDGAAIARWIADPHNVLGSDGQVGLWGCSALGISQLVTAAELGRTSGTSHPVKAMVPGCISGGMYRDTAMDNGIPNSIAVVYSASVAQDAPRFPMGLLQDPPALPSTPFGPSIMAGGPHAYERDFWLDRKWADQASLIVDSGIPALIYVGWKEGGHIGGFDIYGQLQNAYFHRPAHEAMPANGPVTGRYQLFIGDGGHGCCLGDLGVQILWFDHWLKGRNTGVDDSSQHPLHMQELGTDKYVNAKTYPLTTDYTVFRLGAGTLSTAAPAEGSDRIIWGPGVGSETSKTYTSAPLAAGGTIAGAISMTVYASSSNANLSLVGTLNDVAADGTVTEITHGSLLGSLSDLDSDRSWTNSEGVVMRPYPIFDKDRYQLAGLNHRYDFQLQPKLYSVAPGHRIQLTLASQGSPQACAATAGIGPPPLGCFYTAPQLATLPGGIYRLDRTAARPSALNLPLLPLHAFPYVESPTPPTGSYPVPNDWG